MTHAAEPWSLEKEKTLLYVIGSNTTDIAEVWGWKGQKQSFATQQANGQRIIDCVNACAGIPTEALNQLSLGGLCELNIAAVEGLKPGAYRACVEALMLILPLARGYAAKHPVGSNQAYVTQAEEAYRHAEGRKDA